jgi:hypothetical protein
MTVLVGQQSAGTTPDFFASGNTGAFPFVASASGVSAKIFCQLGQANAALTGVKLGIYANSAGSPTGTPLASGTVSPDPTGTGLFSAVAVGANIVSGTTYHLAISGHGEQVDLQGTTSATGHEGVGEMVSWAPLGNMGCLPIIWVEDAVGGSTPAFRPLMMALRKFAQPGLTFRGFQTLGGQRAGHNMTYTATDLSVGQWGLDFWNAAADVTLSPSVGVLTLTADAPTVVAQVTPTIGTLTLTSDAPKVAEQVTPTIGVLTLSAPVPTLSIGGSISPSIGTLTLSAVAPAVQVSTTPSIGSLILSADAPTIYERVTPTIGTLTLSSAAPTVSEQVTPTIGTLILGADAPTTSIGGGPVTVNPSIGVLTLTADAPTAREQVTPSIGTLTLLGNAPTVVEQVTPTIGTLTLTADAPTVATAVKPSIGTLTLSADAPNIANRSITVPTGVLTLSADSPTPTGGTATQPSDHDYRLPFFGLP